MKRHYCPVEKTELSYEGECNWCGEKETNEYQRPHNTVLVPCDKLAEMQTYIKQLESKVGFLTAYNKQLESALQSSLGMNKALVEKGTPEEFFDKARTIARKLDKKASEK